MFKGFQDTRRQGQFKGFPSLNYRMNINAYGYSGVSFWLDAAIGLNTQSNLGAVNSWIDKIGGIKTYQNTAGNQPRLIVADANYNNLPSIEFYDTSRWLITDFPISIDDNFTIVAVLKISTLNNVNNFIGQQANPGTELGFFAGGTNSGYNGHGFGSTTTWSGTQEATTPKIVTLNANGIVVNGTTDSPTGTRTNFATASFNQIGGTALSTSRSFNGSLAELILINRVLSLTDCAGISAALNSKYAIY